MDRYLQQTFEINNLQIGYLTTAGVLQIGVGGSKAQRISQLAGYTTIGTTQVPLSAGPTLFVPAVPLQAPVREKG